MHQIAKPNNIKTMITAGTALPSSVGLGVEKGVVRDELIF